MRLKDKVAIITGAASGIGRATALMFAREGARVVVADISDDKGKQTVAKINEESGEAIFIHTDVTVAEEARDMVKVTAGTFGKLDILVNNAGGGQEDRDLLEVDEDVWYRIVDRNMKSVYLCSKAAIPEMIKGGGGSIVNISSVNALSCLGGFPSYSAAKGGVISLTRVIAVRYGAKGIRANVICPGTIGTERAKALSEKRGGLEKLVDLYPIGRIGRPEDVAYMTLYLASDESPFTTGAVFVVDGGLTAGMRRFGDW